MRKWLIIWLLSLVISPVVANDYLIAYYKQWGVYAPNYHIADLPASLLSHVIYQSADVSADGEILVSDPYADTEHIYPDDDPETQAFFGSFGQLAKLKNRYPHLQTIISVGGWGRSEHYSDIAADPILRERFANSLVAFCERYGFDGAEIDWPYPVRDDSVAQSARVEDRENYTLLLQSVREAFDKHNLNHSHYHDGVGLSLHHSLVLVTSVRMGPSAENNWEVGKVSELVDLLSLETGYMNGYWGKTTNHLSPLYQNAQIEAALQTQQAEVNSVDSALQRLLERGLSIEKTIFNVSAFATGWSKVPGRRSGLYQTAGQVAWGSWDSQASGPTGLYSQSHLQDFLQHPSYVEHWDMVAQSSFLYSPDRLEGHFISFESERSLQAKVDFADSYGMAGFAMREIHNDTHDENALLLKLYAAQQPWQATLIRIKHWWQQNSERVLWMLALVAAVTIVLSWLTWRERSEERRLLEENDRVRRLSEQLQRLQSPLRATLQLGQQLHSADHEQQQQLMAVTQVSRRLLQMVNVFNENSNLLKKTASSQSDSYVLAPLIAQAMQLVAPVAHQQQVNLHCDLPNNDIKVWVDEAMFIDSLWLALSHACHQAPQNSDIYLRMDITQQQLQLQVPLLQHVIDWQSGLAMQKLRDYLLAMNITALSEMTEQGLQLNLLLPMVNSAAQNTQPISLRAPQTTQNQSSMAQPIASLNSFLDKISELRDIDDMVSCAYQFLQAQDFDAQIHLLQGEQRIDADREDDQELLPLQDSREIGDYRFEIRSRQPLAAEQQLYFHSLLCQVASLERQLIELVKEPNLLAELYEIASRRERLHYIMADKGYSALHATGQRNAKYLSLRLKTIKQYFDDDVLLQVHRSYLVNPRRVVRVVQLAKNKYEIELEKMRIPISRGYLNSLKNNYPHWFNAA